MATYRIADAARLLGVSDDTVRRWAEAGKFAASNATPAAVASMAQSWPGSPRH